MKMKGLIALVGSGEYLPVMEDVDRHLLAHCGANGRKPKVVCLPTAAGEEGAASVSRWMRMGEEHFNLLGAEVRSLHVTKRAEADDPANAELVAEADLVYCSGGNPHYLHQTLHGSKLWQAAEKAFERGAVYAGCSAGAMIMGEHMPDFRTLGIRQKAAFGVLPRATIFPHFDQMMRWRGMLVPLIQSRLAADGYALGVDEDTALVGIPGASWQVMGRGEVYVISKNEVKSFKTGHAITLPS
jgi:cyanophycinase